MTIANIKDLYKKHYETFWESLFLVFVYFVGQLPLRDFDLWFHLKSGELFVQQGHLQFTEVFSFAAKGREWIPYEWLFQVTVYLLSKIGLWLIPPFIGIFAVLMFYFFLKILRYIFELSLIPRLFLAFAFFVSIYEFNTARPHVFAYALVCINLFLIFALVFKGKRWIFITPFLTLLWSNWHSSAFLSWGLQISYAGIVIFQWILTREKEKLIIGRDLILISLVNLAVTLLPPIGIKDYKLLWTFYTNRVFLGHFIAEWQPIIENLQGFITYTVFASVSTLSFILVTIKRKSYLESLLGIPLIIMGATSYTASRNVVLGSLGLFLLLGWSLKFLLEWLKSSWAKVFWIVTFILICAFYFFSFLAKRVDVYANRLYYPVQATEFARLYLHGNMFNDYTYGGYILYNAYPQLHVLLDGRADVYQCCEMRDYLLLSIYKNQDDKEYQKFLNEIWKKYDVSFVISATLKNNVWRKITRILNNDPTWALVFWDDNSQIFVKRNDKNDEIIKNLDAKYATPYLKEPYIKGKVDEALKEYQRMEQVAKSARSENAIGFILLQKGQFDNAKKYFKEAKEEDPTFESSYMNLGELAAKNGDLETAISLYKKALRLAPDRGLVYIRLGQLILQKDGNIDAAKKIWQKGVKNTIDDDAKVQLKKLLQTP